MRHFNNYTVGGGDFAKKGTLLELGPTGRVNNVGLRLMDNNKLPLYEFILEYYSLNELVEHLARVVEPLYESGLLNSGF